MGWDLLHLLRPDHQSDVLTHLPSLQARLEPLLLRHRLRVLRLLQARHLPLDLLLLPETNRLGGPLLL